MVAAGVKPADEQLVRAAIAQTAAYLRSTFGSTREDAVINIIASKTADPRPSSIQGGCCGATAGGDVYLDTDDPGWTSMVNETKMKVTAHEYSHSFQDGLGGPLGCIGRDSDNPKRTPVWFYEGWAEYLSYQVGIKSGWFLQSSMVPLVIQRAKQDATATSLRMISVPPLRGARGLYTLGYVAADRLTSIKGPAGIRDFCIAVGRGGAWQAEFQKAFGVSSDSFQDGFNAYVLSLPS